MKHLILLFTFLMICCSINAQSKPMPIPPAFGRNLSKTTVIDSGYTRILYAMNAVDIKDAKTYDDLQRLDIGTRYSKYYSFYYYNNDSLKSEWRKKNPNAQSAPLFLGQFGKKGVEWSLFIWSDYVKDFSENIFIEYAHMPFSITDYQYEEEMPVQKWVTQKDTLTVCGYVCRKATCRFRGRDFTAWFTPELPISNGPWKFAGLPGLILKVFDKDMHYVFECIKVETHEKKFPIVIFHDSLYKKTERTDLRKLEKEIFENYPKVTGVTHYEDGRPIIMATSPYHPLELE